jgi:hypothetical protein
MLLKALVRTGGLGFVLAMSGAALAADDLVDATDPQKLAEIFRGFGSARMDTAADDTPAIRGRIEGNAFSVYFYGCNEQHAECSTINLTASWDMDGQTTLEQINEWNAGKRFGRAYVDSDGNAIVETDINLSGSITYANMEGSIDWWRIIMADFKANVVDVSGASEEPDAAASPPAAQDEAAPAAQAAAPSAPAAAAAPASPAVPAVPATPAEPAPAAAPAEGAAPARGPFSIPRKPNPGN